MNNRKLAGVAAACVAAVLTAGCSQDKTVAVDHSQCDALYEELRGMYIAYTDSLEHMSLNDTVNGSKELASRFEKRMHDIYRKYPADLDESLSPTQNDTLWHYAQLYIQARARHVGVTAVRDTLATDSVAQLADVE